MPIPPFRGPLIAMCEYAPDDTILLAELLSAVAARGYAVSARQAKRLREEGLLRCMRQDYQAGVRGSRSLYLASEIDQLELVMRVGAQERRFDERRVLVAWQGGWVEPTALRASLAKVLDAVSVQVKAITRDSEDPGHAAELLTAGVRKDRSLATTRLMRARLKGNSRALQRVMYAFALLAVGGEVAWSENDPNSTEEPLARIVERATAVDRARSEPVFRDKSLAPSAPPVQVTFDELRTAGLFDIENLARSIQEAGDEALQQALKDAHTLADMALPAEAVEASSGEDAGGLGSVRALVADGLDALSVAILVRNALLMRPIVPDGAFEGLGDAIDGARQPMKAFLEIRRALPEHAGNLTLDLQQRLTELPDAEAEEIQQKLRDLLASNPDLLAS